MSLNPNETAAAPPRPAAAPARTASVTPAETAPARASIGHGAYVQVSAQRSEAEAQASFHGLQAKYPGRLAASR